MSEHFTLNAKSRTDAGRGASRRLRKIDQVPGVLYGAKKPASSLSLSHNELIKSARHESFFSSIITLDIAGKKEKVILRDLQQHAYKPIILHVDFQRVDANEKLHMLIPVHFIGEEDCEGLTVQKGILNKNIVELDIKCLPSDLPEYIEVDISGMHLDSVMHLSEVKLPKGVELAHAVEDEAHDHPIASIVAPQLEVEAPVAADFNPEVPAANQKEEAEATSAEAKK
jgi:large subunit ribosomal protein L25